MPRKGENIYKRKDGRWEGRYIKNQSADGKALYGYCYGKSYKAVKNALSVKRFCQALTPYRPYGEAVFSRYCREWLYLSKERVDESSYCKYLSIVEKHIIPGVGGLKIADISTMTLGEFSQNLTEKSGLSPKTVKDILLVLRSILRYTSQNTDLNFQKIELTYPKESKKEMRVLSPEEQRLFVAFLLENPDPYKLGTLIALLTGLRIGELCALRWRDVSFPEKTVRVSSTMQRIKNTDVFSSAKTKVIISDPKSDTSARVIPLTPFNVSVFERLWQNGCTTDSFVLTGREDRFFEPRVLQYHLGVYLEQCGLKDVHFHTLRHSFATRCVEIGFDVKSLSEILGHSSVKITLDRYVHSSLELKRENMQKLAEIGY